eukprot:TRINITY_DN5730_c2_g1_i1.p1 TRINITY_DN5730_c2_g1~~TRINITY_DN5730_c2_g1_i1.p1  ORF type:complete len:204 (+),score=-17.21 TRINITY_DN5730_c2_g1_i1:208-819(+)
MRDNFNSFRGLVLISPYFLRKFFLRYQNFTTIQGYIINIKRQKLQQSKAVKIIKSSYYQGNTVQKLQNINMVKKSKLKSFKTKRLKPFMLQYQNINDISEHETRYANLIKNLIFCSANCPSIPFVLYQLQVCIQYQTHASKKPTQQQDVAQYSTLQNLIKKAKIISLFTIYILCFKLTVENQIKQKKKQHTILYYIHTLSSTL